MRRSVTTWGRYINKGSFNLLVNEPGPATGGTVRYEDYDVFISHKGDDLKLAERAGDVLSSRGVSGYLDHWDPAVDGDTAELEVHLRSVIRITPGILAVVTEKTPMSWWVPFEIGVGRETDSQVATYLSVDPFSRIQVSLPSYLRTWPILVNESELTKWADTFAKRGQMSYSTRAGYFEKASEPMGIDILESEGKVQFL